MNPTVENLRSRLERLDLTGFVADYAGYRKMGFFETEVAQLT